MSAGDLRPDRIRLTGTAPVVDRAGPRGPHWVVVEESSSFPFFLPPRGEDHACWKILLRPTA